ncbi:hypothetical protein BC938DRAFT_478744 [Jimgerdemannia flammicorona]|uniref:Uncharacterized protein n=1 Tax=Jimgerdemannia flammicorona TaxID=994334 RepID=A0A433QY58_9FUNG|nr:hypothetical protein BC938DRAFT_478744 [Jimgerdemannia flammicorona]
MQSISYQHKGAEVTAGDERVRTPRHHRGTSRKPSSRVPKLRLVVDGGKKYRHGSYGFVGMFILPIDSSIARTLGVVGEHKDITLTGLWRGEAGNGISAPSTQSWKIWESSLLKGMRTVFWPEIHTLVKGTWWTGTNDSR